MAGQRDRLGGSPLCLEGRQDTLPEGFSEGTSAFGQGEGKDDGAIAAAVGRRHRLGGDRVDDVPGGEALGEGVSVGTGGRLGKGPALDVDEHGLGCRPGCIAGGLVLLWLVISGCVVRRSVAGRLVAGRLVAGGCVVFAALLQPEVLGQLVGLGEGFLARGDQIGELLTIELLQPLDATLECTQPGVNVASQLVRGRQSPEIIEPVPAQADGLSGELLESRLLLGRVFGFQPGGEILAERIDLPLALGADLVGALAELLRRKGLFAAGHQGGGSQNGQDHPGSHRLFVPHRPRPRRGRG